MLTLIHGSLEPLVYGLVIFLGLLSMMYKLKTMQFLAFLLSGLFLPILFRSK